MCLVGIIDDHCATLFIRGYNSSPSCHGPRPDASTFQADVKEDAGNEPDASEANNDVMTELDNNTSADDTGGATDTEKGAETKSAEEGGVTPDEEGADDKILGIPSTVFYVGVGALALIGGYLIYRRMKK